MGKAQSKRSVDITTEGKKGPEEEVTGKVEKIEDLDQKQVNGDATPPENNDADKKEADESENDKDLTTEKSAESGGGGDNTGEQNNTTTAAETPKEETNATAAAAPPAEEISPLAEESAKKSKKEKLKKKWSFRSISFGKKDKQKPAKSEEVEEIVAATNGETEKTVPEDVSEEAKKDDGAGDGASGKSGEKLENGNATENELNGQKTPTPIEEKTVADNDTAINNTTTTTATSSASVPAVSNETAIEKETENKTAISDDTTTNNTTAGNAAIISNGSDANDKNGIESPIATDANDVVVTNKLDSEIEIKKTIPNVINDGCVKEIPHQNGTNSGEIDAVVADKCTSQIEVNVHTDYTPAENLNSLHCTSSNPDPQINDLSISDIKNEAESVIVVAISETPVASANDKVVKTCGVSAQCDSQPPPLPISPPPSQVSFFALKDNVEGDEFQTTPTTTTTTTTTQPPIESKSEKESVQSAVILATSTEDTNEYQLETKKEIVTSTATPIDTVASSTEEAQTITTVLCEIPAAIENPSMPLASTLSAENGDEGTMDEHDVIEQTMPETNASAELLKAEEEQQPVENNEIDLNAPAAATAVPPTDIEMPEIEKNQTETSVAVEYTFTAQQKDSVPTEELPEIKEIEMPEIKDSDAGVVLESHNDNEVEHSTESGIESMVESQQSEIVKEIPVLGIEERIAITKAIDEITEQAVEIIQKRQEEEEQEEKEKDILNDQLKQTALTSAESMPAADSVEDEMTPLTSTETQRVDEIEIEQNESDSIQEKLLPPPPPPEMLLEFVDPTTDSNTELLTNAAATDDVVAAENVTLPLPLPLALPLQLQQSSNEIEVAEKQEVDDLSLIAQIEKISLNDVCDELVNPTKDIANPMDLKDNAAAEITTQDLAVTCE